MALAVDDAGTDSQARDHCGLTLQSVCHKILFAVLFTGPGSLPPLSLCGLHVPKRIRCTAWDRHRGRSLVEGQWAVNAAPSEISPP